jgi:hypothetical protein
MRLESGMMSELVIKEPSKLQDAARMDAARTCGGCLEWHKFCRAECCRFLYITGEHDLKKCGALLRVKATLTPDMIRFYDLHGVLYRNGELVFLARNCKQIEGRVSVKAICSKLLADNRCGIHDQSYKPSICKWLNDDHPELSTRNCLYLYKWRLREGEKNDESERSSEEGRIES